MDTEVKAKKAAILMMMNGYPSSQSQITEGTIKAYLEAVEKCSADAVSRSCNQFLSGKVADHNNSFMPTAAELSSNARQWDTAIATLTADREMAMLSRIVVYPIGQEPPPPAEPLGPIKLEIAGRMTDVSHLTFAQKAEAMRTGELPDSPKIEAAPKIRIQRMT